MLIHLEAGTCGSGVGRDEIDDWAFHYSRAYTNNWNDYYRYQCPTCRENFRFVSALLQHVESRACEQEIDGDIEVMLDELEDNVRWY